MRCGLIGEKLGHSYSKEIHGLLGAYEYELIELEKSELAGFLRARAFDGLNVTIPYKRAVMPFCDFIAPLAADIGAVNTLYFDGANADGSRRLCGTNTDCEGFLYAMKRAGIEIAGRNCLILGDGATSKTLRYALRGEGAASVEIASRRLTEEESGRRDGGFEFVSYAEAIKRGAEFSLVLNATPVGMFPNTDGCPAEPAAFPNLEAAFDVVYNPAETVFLAKARALGKKTANGLAMLVAQATAAAGFFLGKPGCFADKNEEIISRLSAELKR